MGPFHNIEARSSRAVIKAKEAPRVKGKLFGQAAVKSYQRMTQNVAFNSDSYGLNPPFVKFEQ